MRDILFHLCHFKKGQSLKCSIGYCHLLFEFYPLVIRLSLQTQPPA